MNALHMTSIAKGFDSVFTEVDCGVTLNLTNNNCLRLFCLDIANNAFSYTGLHQYLQRNIGNYVFSRASIEQFVSDGDMHAIGLKALELLRTAHSNEDKGAGGELGEILLYLFLEQSLHAPKLLSKVELKTSSNQYVFGSDGVHLLALNDKAFQLVLGESKIIGGLRKAVDKAFDSISSVAKAPDHELRLIEKNILSESFDPDTINFLKSLIVPIKRDTKLDVDNAFGVFIGYSIEVDSSNCSNSEFRSKVLTQVKKDLEEIAVYIENKINNTCLSGYSFYFYIMPFNKAAEDRASIIKKLKGEN